MRTKVLMEMKKLRRDRQRNRIIMYSAAVMFGLNFLIGVIDLYLHHWQSAIAAPLAGCLMLVMVIFIAHTDRRTTVLRSQMCRMRIYHLKKMQFMDMDVKLFQEPEPEKNFKPN